MTKLGLRLAIGVLGALGTAAVAPAPASAAPAATYVSYRAGLQPDFALSAQAGFRPPSMVKYNSQTGAADWRREATINGFRLHNRFWAESGASDVCLAAVGTQVVEEPCLPNNSAMRQNWTLEPVNGFHRLKHSSGKYLTYPTTGTVRPVFLAVAGLQQTQILTQRNEI